MSLPAKAVDRLFDRLAAVYGAQWLRQWDGVPMQDVKTAWGHELAVYDNRLDVLAWALDNLPERCPNAIAFRAPCRSCPAPAAPALPMPEVNPERMRAEMEKLGHVLAKPALSTGMMDWAAPIIARAAAGAKVSPTVLRMAREADAIRLRRAA